MKTYRAAVIGCGVRASAHIDAYQYIAHAEVVACCTPSEQRREPLAAKYGIRSYASAEEMIRAEKPDLVHIVTWPDTRVELLTIVSELGVPLCTTEKPLATGSADWRKLVELERGSRTKFAVCHQVRWQPYLRKCQEALVSGALGKLLFVEMTSGMNIAGQGTHTLNYGMALNGDSSVLRVFGSAAGWDTVDPGHPGPATHEAVLVFANGVRGLWTSGPISPRCGDPGTSWQHVRLAAYAEQGRVLYEEFGKWEIVSPAGKETGDYGGMKRWAENNVIAQAEFHKAMFDWLDDDGKAPGTAMKQALHEWAVVLALYQSALRHSPVEMEGFDPPNELVEQFKRMADRLTTSP